MDGVNFAIQSGTRKMNEFIWPKEEVQVDGRVELPVVDLEKLRKANPAELGELLKDLVKICEHWGFFRVVNHGVSYDVLRKLESQTLRIFSLPSEVKKNVPTARNSKYVNFSSGADTNAFRKLWWQESFQLFCDPEHIDQCTEKLWPDGDGKEFSSTIKDHMKKSHDLALEILHYITTALSIDSTKFLQQCSVLANSVIALNHYPICKNPQGVLGISAHTDEDVLTISYELDQVGGLQIQKDSTWFDVKPQPDTLVVYIGDVMQAWSNNKYSSVPHRVAANSDKRRVSVPFFLCPKPESLIEPAVELINAENPAKYKRFSYDELFQISYSNGEKSKQVSKFELS